MSICSDLLLRQQFPIQQGLRNEILEVLQGKFGHKLNFSYVTQEAEFEAVLMMRVFGVL